MIYLQFPDKMSFSDNDFLQYVARNPDISMNKSDNKLLFDEEEAHDLDMLELQLPYTISQETFENLINENPELKLEYNPNSIHIIMGTIGIIGAFTLAISTAIFLWNKNQKFGKVFDSQSDYILEKNKRRIPDASVISAEKFKQKVYSETGFITAKPTLIVEVVSKKSSLKKELRKMENDWMPAGTEIGLLVSHFHKEYYVFEKGKEKPQKYPFSKVFMHNKLPELSLNFNELLKDALSEKF